MDLILWRHADAEDLAEGGDDLQRALTPRGIKQAASVAGWLDRQLPEGTRILCSPARRCEHTARALGRKYRLSPDLAPDAGFEQLLQAAQWPDAKSAVLVIGHQPALGEAIAHLMQLVHPACAVRKGAVWWLRTRERDGHQQTVVAAVQSPDTL